ncbi:hypothetical protein NXH67_14015 [Butyrivibrio sp. DSM 10294]|uniref:hypothetical protein n=1 Tax=Butyrivibrio sp. DSM 10294 TaxID=2972457 RepID=UPI00234EDD35|nr:hypothetical protein [Butyrivibrio sp. DSM 10294]MDC7294630.1 hypothetical protein [Butyrivibrio sp. DSM 10294]
MGYKNKKYKKDLTQQMNDRLTMMLHSGEGTSKKEAIANGTERDKIFSYSTYESYFKHCKYFSRYVRENHPEVKSLKQAKRYVNEWLQSRVDNGGINGKPLSAYTITLEREALGKLYGIKPDDKDFFLAPRRHRADIVRSRGDAVRDRHFSEKNNDEFVKFCKGTGCRRNIMEKLEGRDLKTRAEIDREIALLETQTRTETEEKHLNALKDSIKQFPDQDYFIHHRKDKGGRERYSPIIGDNKQQIVDRMKATAPHEKVWKHVSGNADIHGYRADYAGAVYRLYARPIEEIPYDRTNKGTGKKFQGDVYTCRKDKAGKKLDRAAMLKASKALGHNRIEVIANNYLR